MKYRTRLKKLERRSVPLPDYAALEIVWNKMGQECNMTEEEIEKGIKDLVEGYSPFDRSKTR